MYHCNQQFIHELSPISFHTIIKQSLSECLICYRHWVKSDNSERHDKIPAIQQSTEKLRHRQLIRQVTGQIRGVIKQNHIVASLTLCDDQEMLSWESHGWIDIGRIKSSELG